MSAWWVWRLWDVLASAAPLGASALAGSLLLAWITRDDDRPRPAGPASILGLGCAVVQAGTWAVALFAPAAIAAAWHWSIVGAGLAAMGLAVTPLRSAALAPLRRWSVRLGLFAAPLLGFVVAHPNPVGQTPSDALAYHLPAAHWFAIGGAWSELPSLLWTAQLPLASSLWASFATGAHVPIADPLVAWIAVNVAVVAWTGVVVAEAAAAPDARPVCRLLAAGVGVALVFGAYTAQSGFVDYVSALLAVCLVTMAATGSPAVDRPWLLALVAGALAECRPQGLILAGTLVLAVLALAPWHAWRTGASRGRLVALVVAGAAGAKWWAIVWWRWGTPFVPILGTTLGASPEVRNAEAVYRGQWPPAPLIDGLGFTFGSAGVPAITVAAWLLVVVVALVAWRAPRAPGGTVTRAAALAPLAWVIFIASQNPTQSARMAIVAVPVAVALAGGLIRACRREDALVRHAWSAALVVILATLLGQAPGAWHGEMLSVGSYPTLAGELAMQARRQLEDLGDRDACLLDQYGAPLAPRGIRYIGGLVPPWSTLPARLETADDWTRWLRQHGARSVLTKAGWRLTGIWMPLGAPSHANTQAFDAWVQACPGQSRAGDWFVCPLPSD